MKKTLNPGAEAKIQNLGKKGREAWSGGNIEEAEKIFLECWATIPEPKFDYDYSQILSGGLVKFFRDTRQIEKAKHWIGIMRNAYDSNTDLEVEFLAATVYYEANELNKARKIFESQYKKYGKRPFEGKDRKYLQFTIDSNNGE
ncbi:TPA: hypothetical protein U8251_002323 [Pseudomonas putida]|nr:hypothetical protein [Pseudomonas putida]